MKILDKASVLLRYVYLLESDGLYKIGFARDPNTRRKRLQTGSPKPIRIVHTIRTWHYRHVEEKLHDHFDDKRVRGEWFALDADDVAYFKTLDSFGKTPEENAKRAADDAAFLASDRHKQQMQKMRDFLNGTGKYPFASARQDDQPEPAVPLQLGI